ncbi:hypothetical protein [Streptomyces sp. BK340]|uniref:hypothetical protein n=1 Tax=Streptomyces sp. BK340 TaxID=2572903 RepID=UPI00119D44B3|nr:hypothetical protein [Streptomyces sp. BK340]TVZ79068.1 hypothetical protein FB157_13366 [Streptomyces sp. BK340]
MDHPIDLVADQDPSRSYRLLPAPPACAPRELTVTLRKAPRDSLQISMWSETGLMPQPRGGSHHALLTIDADRLDKLSARLISRWQRFVQFTPMSETNRPREKDPYKRHADLSGRPKSEVLAQVTDLVREGGYLLTELLAGEDEDGGLPRFRSHLLQALKYQNLRIRFDSPDVGVPWPMLAVGSESLLADGRLTDDPFRLFLGYRHQIEATAGAHPDFWWVANRGHAVGSANLDDDLKNVPLAEDVLGLLRNRLKLTERRFSHDLLPELARPVLDEDLMYFFCHGAYEEQGGHTWHALRLSDDMPIDEELVNSFRKPYSRAHRRPLVCPACPPPSSDMVRSVSWPRRSRCHRCSAPSSPTGSSPVTSTKG